MALQLAGLHAQVLWGEYDKTLMNRYDEVEQYIHSRIMAENKTRTFDDWKKEIAKAHNVSHYNYTILQTTVKPLYNELVGSSKN